MAYWIAGQTPHAKHFMCDTDADVMKLPTTITRGVQQKGIDDTSTYTVQAGSTAKVIATGDKYILQSDIDTWVKQPASGSGGGEGGGGVTDYNMLQNRPVINIAGRGVVISALTSGVYNIDGTWKMTTDDAERDTGKDDLFYVFNDDSGSRMTWVSAGKITTFGVPNGGTAADITESETATISEVVAQLVGDF